MSDERINKIKQDLRLLRKLNHIIDSNIALKRHHEDRLTWLKEREPSSSIVAEIKKTEDILKSIDIQKEIRVSNELESRYLSMINALDPIDRTIITEAFLNGVAYWKVGRSLGFEERGIQNRVKKAIEKMAKM